MFFGIEFDTVGMKQAWQLVGFTYLVTIIVSLGVAVLIHLMTTIFNKFGRTPPGKDTKTEDTNIAIAVAAAVQHKE